MVKRLKRIEAIVASSTSMALAGSPAYVKALAYR
jgi:hypothetical protein